MFDLEYGMIRHFVGKKKRMADIALFLDTDAY